MATLSRLQEAALERIDGKKMVKKVRKLVSGNLDQAGADAAVNQAIASFRKHHPDPFDVKV